MKAGKYQIVHAHSAKAGILGRLAARRARVPIIIQTFHCFSWKVNGVPSVTGWRRYKDRLDDEKERKEIEANNKVLEKRAERIEHNVLLRPDIQDVLRQLLDTKLYASEEEVIASVRYALKHGMPGGGYILSTSNCIYTGMPLARYELMLDVWRKEWVY